MSGRPSPRGAWLGYAEAVCAAALWGSSGIFSVHLFRMGVPPSSIALLRPVLGLAFLLPVLALTRPQALRVERRGLVVLVSVGGVSMGLFQMAYQLSIDAVGVPSTVALLYLAPALVVAVSGPLLQERPTRMRVALAAIVTVGVWLSVLGADEVEAVFGSRGVGWGILAALCYTGYLLLGRIASPRWGSVPTMVYSTTAAVAFLSVVLPFLPGTVVLPSTAAAWGLLAAFGLLTVAGAQFLFFDALGRIEASGVAVSTTAEPLVAALLATSLLGQGLDPIGWIGLFLLVLGVAGVGFTLGRPSETS